MKRDGHIENARVVNGARTKAFDDAVLAAIRAVGDSQAAPPFVETMKGKTLDLRLSICLTDGVVLQIVPGKLREPRYEPLFAMRVPSFGLASTEAAADPNNPRPEYPWSALKGNAGGSTIAEFLVRPDGTVDLGSVQFLTATAVGFVDAVLKVLPKHRYTPMAIDGCPVATLQRQWFKFEIRKPPARSRF